MKTEIFLIHGWNMPPIIWEPVREQLADRFNVTLAKMPGYSSSETIANSGSQRPLDTVMASLLEQSPPASHWVGWSLGATLAMACAIKHSPRINRLTLICPTPSFTLRPDWEFGYDQKTFHSLLKITQRRFERGSKQFLSLQSLGDLLPKTLANICTHQPTGEALTQGFDILCHSDLRNQIANIKIPTQIIAASADNVVPPQASHWVAEAIPQSTLHTVGAGHGIPIIDAQAIADLIADFSMGRTS